MRGFSFSGSGRTSFVVDESAASCNVPSYARKCGLPSEVFSRELVRLVRLPRSWNERDGLHLLQHALVGRDVPMVISGIRVQILLVARLSDRPEHAPFFGGLDVV